MAVPAHKRNIDKDLTLETHAMQLRVHISKHAQRHLGYKPEVSYKRLLKFIELKSNKSEIDRALIDFMNNIATSEHVVNNTVDVLIDESRKLHQAATACSLCGKSTIENCKTYLSIMNSAKLHYHHIIAEVSYILQSKVIKSKLGDISSLLDIINAEIGANIKNVKSIITKLEKKENE